MSLFSVSAVIPFMTRTGGNRRMWQLMLLVGLLLGSCKGRKPDPKPINGPDCTNFTNKTTVNGLGSNDIQGVYTTGSTIYVATTDGLSISTDGGNTFTNKTTINGLGKNSVHGVYEVGNTLYVATEGGLSISTDMGNTFTNKTSANGLGGGGVQGVYGVGNTIYAAT